MAPHQLNESLFSTHVFFCVCVCLCAMTVPHYICQVKSIKNNAAVIEGEKIESLPHSLCATAHWFKAASCPFIAHNIIQPLLIYTEAFRAFSDWVLKTIRFEYRLQFACKPPRLGNVISSPTQQKDLQKRAEISKQTAIGS